MMEAKERAELFQRAVCYLPSILLEQEEEPICIFQRIIVNMMSASLYITFIIVLNLNWAETCMLVNGSSPEIKQYVIAEWRIRACFEDF